MAQLLTIAEAKKFQEGQTKGCSLNVTVVSCDATKTGKTSKGTDWTKRDVTVSDNTDNCVISEWGETVGKLEAGFTYQIEGVNRSLYNGIVQFGCGKFTKFNKGDTQQATMPQPQQQSQQQPQQSEDEFFAKRQKEIREQQPQQPQNIQPIELEESIAKIVECKTELLYAINKRVEDVLRLYEPSPNPAKIGQFTRIIWDTLEAQK